MKRRVVLASPSMALPGLANGALCGLKGYKERIPVRVSGASQKHNPDASGLLVPLSGVRVGSGVRYGEAGPQ